MPTENEEYQARLDKVTLLAEHLRVDPATEINLLELYLDSANEWIAAYIGKPLAEVDPLPVSIRQASIMLASHWYENREATASDATPRDIPFGATDLLSPHREWTF